jgi:hypothetical protein
MEGPPALSADTWIGLGRVIRLKLHRSGPWIGVGGVVALLFVAFPVFFQGLAPWWGNALIVASLVIQLIIIARLAKSRPAWCIWVPVFGLVAYFVLLFVGLKWWSWG